MDTLRAILYWFAIYGVVRLGAPGDGLWWVWILISMLIMAETLYWIRANDRSEHE